MLQPTEQPEHPAFLKLTEEGGVAPKWDSVPVRCVYLVAKLFGSNFTEPFIFTVWLLAPQMDVLAALRCLTGAP